MRSVICGCAAWLCQTGEGINAGVIGLLLVSGDWCSQQEGPRHRCCTKASSRRPSAQKEQESLIRGAGGQVSGADVAGQWREAVEEVKRFRADGGLPNTVAYNSLVRLAVPEQERAAAPWPAGA